MKRIAIFVLFVVTAVFLMGCSNDSGVLTEDEFNIYLNGKKYFDIKDAVDENGTYTYVFSEEANFDVETKRGLKIGSTITQVKELYGNIDMTSTDRLEVMPLNEYLKQNQKKQISFDFLLLKFNGKLYGSKEYFASDEVNKVYADIIKIYESRNYTQDDEKYIDSMPDIEEFTFTINIKEGKVEDILINYKSPDGVKKWQKESLKRNAGYSEKS